MTVERININDISDDEYLHAVSLMQDERKLVIARKKKDADRKLSIAGEMLSRRCISTAAGKSPDEIIFERDENGKPYTTSSNIHFNVSHSGEYAVCAVSSNLIGIDIEEIRQVNTDLTKKFCTEKEMNYVFEKENDADETCRRLISIWTLKEAYFKALGTGISRDLKVVEFLLEENKITCSDADYSALLDFSTDGYIIAVCEKAS